MLGQKRGQQNWSAFDAFVDLPPTLWGQKIYHVIWLHACLEVATKFWREGFQMQVSKLLLNLFKKILSFCEFWLKFL